MAFRIYCLFSSVLSSFLGTIIITQSGTGHRFITFWDLKKYIFCPGKRLIQLLVKHKCSYHCKMNIYPCFGSFIRLKLHLQYACHLSDAFYNYNYNFTIWELCTSSVSSKWIGAALLSSGREDPYLWNSCLVWKCVSRGWDYWIRWCTLHHNSLGVTFHL